MPASTDTGRIAINAQLNPLGSGGVETNLLSMLEALSGEELQFSVSLLALDQYVEPFLRKAPFADVNSWPFGQKLPAPLAPDATPMKMKVEAALKAQGLRNLLGRPADVVDDLVYRYKLLRDAKSRGTRASIDAALSSRGIRAVHFPTPQFFDTRLPYLYEPWDLQHLHYPQFFKQHEYEYREQVYRAGCRRATLVLTATRWAKDDIAKRYNIPRKRIVAIPRSSLITRQALGKNQIEAELRKAGVPDEFIFYPAMCFEHKNHIRLFQALALLRDRDGLRVNLILSGRTHQPFWPNLARAIKKLQLRTQVTMLGNASEALLTALFSRARFMVFPSLFEGLGFPVLEAFYHGLPVIAARATCLPEVIGDAGLLFDPTDAEAIAAMLRRAYQEPVLLRELAEKGRQRLDEFSWERGRTLLVACYKHVLGMHQTEEEGALFTRATSY